MEGLCSWLTVSPEGRRVCRPRTYSSSDESVAVLEVYRNRIGDSNEIVNRTLHSEQLIDWSKEVSRLHSVSSERELATRIVWLSMDTEADQLSIQWSTLVQIMHNFRIRAVSIQGFTASAGCLPFADAAADHSDLISYSIAFPDIPFGAAWSVDKNRMTSQGIVWAIPSRLYTYREVIEHQAKLADHPMIIPLVISSGIGRWISTTMEKNELKIRGIEIRTGHHDWTHLHAESPQGTYDVVSTIIGGCATNMTYVKRRLRIQREMLAIVKEFLVHADRQPRFRMRRKHNSVREVIAAFENLLNLHEIELEYLVERTRIQQTVIFHQMTQQDARLSIEMAKDSRALAAASKKDSSAMKSLTVVAGLFLPGTFVASLFAMPFFHLEDGTIMLSRDMWKYWIVTIPLTVTVLAFWFLWMTWRERSPSSSAPTPKDGLELSDLKIE